MEQEKTPVAYTSRVHVPALDGIRGIAILLVMAHHFTAYGMGVRTTVLDRRVYNLLTVGWCGVDLFFVLSGFLITGILLDAKGAAHFFRNFYMRRVLRIFPLYYGFLIVVFFLLPLALPVDDNFRSLLDKQGWYWSYLINVWIAFKGWPRNYSVAHFWSLAVEEQFYLFWPLVVFFCGRRQLIVVCLACFVVSLGVRLGFAVAGNPSAGYVLTPARMDILVVGALLALIVRGPNGLIRFAAWAWPIGGASAAILAAIFVWKHGLHSNEMVVQTIGYPMFAVTFGALLVAALSSSTQSRTGKVFAHPILVFFGRYSYGLYVFHHPVALIMRTNVAEAGGLPVFLGSQLPSLVLFFAAATVISLSLALLSWHGYEVHFLKLKALFPQSSGASIPHVRRGPRQIHSS
jgi:peptidoglycan/LPS O-acetylase OafA/YrhL